MDFADEIDRIYRMFGIINCLKIENGTYDEVYDLVFNIEVPRNIKFINDVSRCNEFICNNINHNGETYATLLNFNNIGDIISYYGDRTETNLMVRPYYEYPLCRFSY